MQYGVFVLRGERWAMWAEYPGLANARDEVRYLSKMLGLRADVFKRVAA